MLEKRLRAFADWMMNHSETCFDTMTEGSFERQIRHAQDATINKIGDMLDELLNMSDKQIDIELTPEKESNKK
jgi:hypothetical protein